MGHAPLAQLDRASGYGPEGRGLESLTACHPETVAIQRFRGFLFHREDIENSCISNAFLTRQTLGQLFCQSLLPRTVKMPIDVSCGLNVTVSHPLLHILQPAALIQQQACTAMPLRYNYDKPEKPRISRVFGYRARFFILFQTEKSSREVMIF